MVLASILFDRKIFQTPTKCQAYLDFWHYKPLSLIPSVENEYYVYTIAQERDEYEYSNLGQNGVLFRIGKKSESIE